MNDEGAYVPGVGNAHRGTCCDAERQPSHISLNNFRQKGLGACFHYLKQNACILGIFSQGWERKKTISSCQYGCCGSVPSSLET